MAQVSHIAQPTVSWRLRDEGMDFLYRAGLAGLYLTLTAAEDWGQRRNNKDNKAIVVCNEFEWTLNDDSVALRWEDDESLMRLLDWAWQIKGGVYYLPGVHRSRDDRENKFRRLVTHNGLVGTFMQFGGRLRPKLNDKTEEIVPLEENNQINIRFRPAVEGETVRQQGDQARQSLIPFRDQCGEYRALKDIAGWIYPGSAPRFGNQEGGWQGNTAQALLLIFAPIACGFAELLKTKAKKKSRDNWLFLVPDINSLEHYAEHFPEFTESFRARIEGSQCLSVADATLQFAVRYAANANLYGNLIYTVSMGVTDYYSSTPTVTTRIRTNVFRFDPRKVRMTEFQIALDCLSNHFATSGDSNERRTWIARSRARHRVADNIASGWRWYQDLMFPPTTQVDDLNLLSERRDENISKERLWFELLGYEKEGLQRMSDKAEVWVKPEEQYFLSSFSNALRRLLDREEQAVKRGGSRTLKERWEDCEENIRRQLLRVKTQPLAREIIMKLLAEAGGGKDLTEHRAYVWKILNDPHDWQRARDLCFLALVTFTDGRLAAGQKDSQQQIPEDQ